MEITLAIENVAELTATKTFLEDKMYQIQIRHDTNVTSGAILLYGGKIFYSLKEAEEARKVSGDLVVHFGTGRVVNSQDWLWEWEKKDFKCYAQRAIKNDAPTIKDILEPVF